MKAALRCVASALFMLAMAGCASPYRANRARDAADIFTATVGKGAGASVRIGPAHVGLYAGGDRYGLRCGEVMWPKPTLRESFTIDPLIFFPNFGGGPTMYWCDVFEADDRTARRDKSFAADGVCPFLSWPRSNNTLDIQQRDMRRPAAPYLPRHYLTQCELTAGLWITVRLGFNPGELVDFILGWTTIDIFNDDLSPRLWTAEPNQPAQPAGKPATGR